MTPPEPAAAEAVQTQRRGRGRARLRDALRLLPVLGLALFILPDLVLSHGPAGAGATAPWLTYLFVSWALLIAISICLALAHRRGGVDPDDRADG